MKAGMEKISLKDVAKYTGGKLFLANDTDAVTGVVIDSREAGEGDLFIAIIGENHDAHKFIKSAYEQGCRAFLVSSNKEASELPEASYVLCENTEIAMGMLAKWYLSTLNLKKIAITGSMGKTTTRDMIYAMSSTKYRTGKPIKNYNSLIGISMTIFTFNRETEVAVLEVGMERLGEIHELTEIIEPEIGVLTYVGMTHIDTLGSRENIYKAKMEIVDFLSNDGSLIINENCPVIEREKIRSEVKGDFEILTVGSRANPDYRVTDIKDFGDKGIAFRLWHGGRDYSIELDVPGAHNAYNCALALAAVGKLGIGISEALKGLTKLERTDKRLQIKKSMFMDIKIIDDSYSSFPEAAKAAVDTLMLTEGNRHIVIFAGMNGLGEESEDLHMELGKYCKKKGVSLVVAVGHIAENIAEGAKGGETDSIYMSENSQVIRQLKGLLMDGDAVLVKGSRIFKMEEVVKAIEAL